MNRLKIHTDNFVRYNLISKDVELQGMSVQITCTNSIRSRHIKELKETFWVRIVKVIDSKLVGMVNNTLICNKTYNLGHLVFFDRSHILKLKSGN